MTTVPREKGTILIVDDEPTTNVGALEDYLWQNDLKVLVALDGESAIEQAKFAKPDLILLDIVMPGMDGFETCLKLKADDETREIPIIFMTALADTADKVRGFELGAVDYVTKPFQIEEVLSRVTTHITLRNLQRQLQEERDLLDQRVRERTAELEKLKNQLEIENEYLREEIEVSHNFEEIIGESDALKAVLQKVEMVAPTDSTVVILGESGTGKELIARAIHDRSPRGKRAMVTVNCAAIPENMVESELFGHERGAFTGAIQRRKGRFEFADGSTIFLDEIGDLTPNIQAKLLRILQEQRFERVGGNETITTDVRVIAATNRNLADLVNKGEFREDLFFRLNVFPLELPPLRDRPSDIPLLIDFFVRKCTQQLGKSINSISKASKERLMNYHWPGNVRELQNIIERSVILASGPTLRIEETFAQQSISPQHLSSSPSAILKTFDEMAQDYISQVLDHTRGNIAQAAEILGIPRGTLRSRMEKLGVQSTRSNDTQ